MFTQNYRLNEQGLNHFNRLKRKLWRLFGLLKVLLLKKCKEKLSEESPVNFNTVMTVMNRLVEKLHLEKQTVKRSGIYRAVQTKEEFYPIKRRK